MNTTVKQDPNVKSVPRRILSIRIIVTAAAVLLIGGGVVSVGLVTERSMRETLTAEVEARLLLDVENLSLAAGHARK